MKDYAKYNSKKDSARSTVYYHQHVKGDLKKKPCAKCGSSKSEAHHPDYQNPKRVQWLCRDCHAKVSARQRVKKAIRS